MRARPTILRAAIEASFDTMPTMVLDRLFVRGRPRSAAVVARLACVVALTLTDGCGGQKAAVAPSRCGGDRSPPSVAELRTLPTGPAGGANAWFEARVTRAEPVLADNHVLLDSVEVPIVRVKAARQDAPGAEPSVIDATGGQLTPRAVRAKYSASEYRHVVSFRIPPGTPPGKRQLRFKTCDVAAEESLTIDVLPSPAPVITSIKVVRGEQWPVLLIKGANLIDAEEVILVGSDDAIASIPNVTKIDDGEIRATLDRSGSYEVFVRTRGGVGGGPPAGVVTLR